MGKPFDFNTQLVAGNEGESDFVKYYADEGPVKSSDRSYDFLLANGKKVELKTDTYDMNDTMNFFMEMFGNVADSKIGGPWRALQDGVDFFVYYFPKNKIFFWFETTTLCKALDVVIAGNYIKPKEIRNKGWTTLGYAVPRESINGAVLKINSF